MIIPKIQWPYVFVVATGAFLAGCSTYSESTQAVRDANRVGRYDASALGPAKMVPAKEDDKNAVIFNLEAGMAYRTWALAKADAPAPVPAATPAPAPTQAGAVAPVVPVDPDAEYKIAVRYFDNADARIDYYDEQAKHSVASGLKTALVNPAETPYRGQAYDKIMLSTYQALNYLVLSDPEKARASFNKAYRRQSEAVEANSKRIEKNKERIAAAKSGELTDENGKKASQGADPEKSMKDPKAAAALDNVNQSIETRLRAYGDYVNPFAVFMDGLFMMTNASDKQEQERAAKEFVRVASMVSENPYIKDEAVLAEQLAAGTAVLPKLTYVIFESGEAPRREELLIPIPIFLVSKEMIYTQLPLSRLVFNDQYNANVLVLAGGQQKATATICNMDSVVGQDFKNALPSMWVDAFLCAATKALIEHETNKQLDKNVGGWGSVVGKVGFMIFNAATTRADTRSWQTLPKTYSYARLETPADGVLTISCAGNQTKVVKLPEATVSLVFVKQVSPGSPLLVDAIKLR